MKALLVECLTPKNTPRTSEVSDIAKAAGYDIVDTVTQRRETPDSAYYIGEGKLVEMGKRVEKESIKALVFTRQLSAGQVFRIKKKIANEVTVIDRNLLILEVFEKRCATQEAKLQIELARLRYTFSWAREAIRAHGIAGEQMGRGGPGQYPYEINEAMTRKRISRIERQLRVIRSKQSDLRHHRGKVGFRIVALTGYTQSGKTTLFNKLASESKETGLGPFTTLSTYARRVSTSDGADPFIMIDSIGFIEDLNPILLDAFHTTLNELANSDLALLFLDGSEDIQTVKRKLSASSEIMKKEVGGIPILVCVNKIDAASREHLDEVLKEVHKTFEGEDIIEISAKTGANLQYLLGKISKTLDEPPSTVSVGS